MKLRPYAYAQALFADGQYSAAAAALRQALDDIDPEKQGVFYPRGLYGDEDILFDQIEQLLDKLERYGFDGDHPVADPGRRRMYSNTGIERATGRFLRRFTLPETVDADAIAAKCANGILEVTIPKAPEIQARRITVEAA